MIGSWYKAMDMLDIVTQALFILSNNAFAYQTRCFMRDSKDVVSNYDQMKDT